MTTSTSHPLDEALDLPCPAWCVLPPGHDWDSIQPKGGDNRGHQGPDFGLGEYVSVGATEFSYAPGVLTMHVTILDAGDLNEMTAEQTRSLAQSLIEAAAWLEANRP
jgi:hypothetical protein